MAVTLFDRVKNEARDNNRLVVHDTVIPSRIPADQLKEDYGLVQAIMDELQNHVDAATAMGTDAWVREVDGGFEIGNKGRGYHWEDVVDMKSCKRKQITDPEGNPICTIGYNGEGIKLAALRLISEGVGVQHSSLDWIIGAIPVVEQRAGEKRTFVGMNVISGMKKQDGSLTMLYNVPKTVADLLQRSEEYFLLFRDRKGWKPIYSESKWHIAGIDSIIDKGGEVWCQGAYVFKPGDLVLGYNFNSIRRPDDRQRTVINERTIEKAIEKLLGICYDPGVIRAIVERGFETRDSKKEWSILADKVVPSSDMKELYKSIFYDVCAKRGLGDVVIQSPYSKTPKRRIRNTLEKLGVQSVSLNPSLASFIHECGVPYDSDLTLDWADLMYGDSSEFSGNIRRVDNLQIRRAKQFDELDINPLVQTAMGFFELHRKFGYSFVPNVQLLVETTQDEKWINFRDYNLYRQGKGIDNSSLFKYKQPRFAVPDWIDGNTAESYFRFVRAVRVVLPIKGGLNLTDIGEAYRDDDQQPIESKLTKDQMEATSFLDRAFSDALAWRTPKDIAVRSQNWIAKAMKKTFKGNQRNTLDALVGLTEDPDLRDSAGIILGIQSDKDRRALMDFVYNISSYVLHLNPDYRPIAANSNFELVSIHSNRQYQGGYFVKGEFRSCLFSYNVKFTTPLDRFVYYPDNYRALVIESKNIEVYKKLIEAAKPDVSSKVEFVDYFKWAKENGHAIDGEMKSKLREAFHAVHGKLAVIGIDPQSYGKMGLVGNQEVREDRGRIVSGDMEKGVKHLVDASAYYRNANSYRRAAEAMGYKVVDLEDGIARTLVKAGVMDDIDAVIEGCSYVRTKREFDDRETRNIGVAKELLSLFGKETGLKYEVEFYDHLTNKKGVVLPDSCIFSNVREGDTFRVYIRQDQLKRRTKDFAKDLLYVAVNDDAAQNVIINQVVGKYGAQPIAGTMVTVGQAFKDLMKAKVF